ncbi:MAG: response regulator [Desulfamplus sp.]|nr:response regulator [Desulfamplus sp.]
MENKIQNEQTILIVDDNPTNLGVLTENLKSWGFNLMVARSGESGLQKAIKGKPDFILLDIYMPGMNGFEVCKKLKEDPSTSGIPIIFLTADSDQTDKIKGFEMGAVDYITKPFNPEEVLARINRHLEIHFLRKQLETQNIQITLQNEQIKLKNSQLENEIIERQKAEEKQRELEATNMRLEKAESLGQMAGGIAHLFNNYLATIVGHLELALEDLTEDSYVKDNIESAIKAVWRASDVSNAMLTYIGQKIISLEPVDISECCRRSLAVMPPFSNSNIGIETNFADKKLIINASASQMQQLINHLITNAYESIVENKGKISIITKSIDSFDIPQSNLFPAGSKPSSNKYGYIEVTDTGYGIPEEDIGKIFDPFFTTKFIGRGLGLATVLGIVKSWQGMIAVNSKTGHGTSFMIFVPLSFEEESVRPLRKIIHTHKIESSPTVLLVEDNQMVLNMTTSVLKNIGCKVISAVNGMEAIELFKIHKHSISCIITDLSMPGIDGWTTLSKIRNMNPNIPAILASGYDEAFAMAPDNPEKPQAFLHKPYSMKELQIALEKALNASVSA